LLDSAHAAVVVETFDFNDNKLPSAWTTSDNVFVQNHRLEYGRGPFGASASFLVKTPSIASLKVEFDAHFEGAFSIVLEFGLLLLAVQ
jgi:hypothetical protein